jgi:hypothetical protein
MPHTASRYQQDLGFTDGYFYISAATFIASASAVLTRNAASDFSYNLGSSLGPITLSAPLSEGTLVRTGFGEDIQEQFGGTGIPGSAQPQVYRPDVIPAMSAIQQITPRTALKVKGFKPISIEVIYQITVANLTTHNVRVDKINHGNQATDTITSMIADGANGLSKTFGTAATSKYVTLVPFPAGQQIYQITDLANIWAEITVTTPASSLYRLYAIVVDVEFNYN